MGGSAPSGVPKDRHERLLAMRAERRLLADPDVAAACEEVDNSGLVPLLQEFVHLGRGRPRNLSLRTLLIGLHLCTQIHGGRVVLERVTDILFFRISATARERLGIPDYPDHDQGFEAGYAVVRRLFHAMRKAMDPSPLPANKLLSREKAAQLTADADLEALAEREHRLALFTEFVLDASVRPLKDLLAELSDGSLAVDATPIRTFAKGRKTNGPELATDPDAGWYVREGDHRDPDTAPVAGAMRPSAKRGKKSGSLEKTGKKRKKGKNT